MLNYNKNNKIFNLDNKKYTTNYINILLFK